MDIQLPDGGITSTGEVQYILLPPQDKIVDLTYKGVGGTIPAQSIGQTNPIKQPT
jgi:hypothetical protein